MTQDWISLRDALRTILLGVANVQIVHAFPRLEATNHVSRWRKFLETFSRIDAMTILRTAAEVTFYTNCEVQVLHQVTIRVVMEHNDELSSQDEFDTRIDAIMTQLYPQVSLTETATLQGPANLAVEELHILADKTVHYAEITTVVNQTVLVTGQT